MKLVASLWSAILCRARAGRKRKLSSIVIVLAIAIGIGSVLTSVAALRALVYDIYPYPQLDELAYVGPTTAFQNNAIVGTSVPTYLDIAERAKSYTELGFMVQTQQNVATDAAPERVPALQVTPSIFRLFGVTTVIGRGFTEDDVAAGRDDIAVISYRAWQDLFGADPAIVGRSVRLDNKPHRVVGVLSPDMYILMKSYRVVVPFLVTNENRAEARRNDQTGTIFGRLKPGVPLGAAREEIQRIREQILTTHPELQQRWNANDSRVNLNVDSLRSNTFRFGTMWIIPVASYSILALAIMVLVLCAFNVVTMMLAEMGERGKEFAIRTALGADRRDIARQLVCENVIQYLIGAAGGIVLTLGFVGSLRAVIESNEMSGKLQLDWRLAALGVGTAVLLGLLSGLMLTRLFVGPLPATGMKPATVGLVRGWQGGMLGVLVVGQLAVAFALLVCGNFMRATTQNVEKIQPGFATKDVLVARLEFPPELYPDEAALKSATDRVLGQVRGVGEGVRVAVSSSLPFNGGVAISRVRQGSAGPQDTVEIRKYTVSDDYFETLSIPLRAGRYLLPTDGPSDTPTVVIDDALATRVFAGRSPVGEALMVDERACRVVGVVGAVRHTDLREEYSPGSVYFNVNQVGHSRMALFAIRTRPNESRAMYDTISKVIRATEPMVPRFWVAPIDQPMQNVINIRERMISLVLGLGGAMATFLAILGSYGVLSFTIECQVREFAIRIALGATTREIVRLVAGLAARYIAWGVGFGLLAALGCAKLMQSVLYGVSPWTPGPYGTTALILVVVGVAAVTTPCLRAIRTAPMQVLKEG